MNTFKGKYTKEDMIAAIQVKKSSALNRGEKEKHNRIDYIAALTNDHPHLLEDMYGIPGQLGNIIAKLTEQVSDKVYKTIAIDIVRALPNHKDICLLPMVITMAIRDRHAALIGQSKLDCVGTKLEELHSQAEETYDQQNLAMYYRSTSTANSYFNNLLEDYLHFVGRHYRQESDDPSKFIEAIEEAADQLVSTMMKGHN